MQKTPILAFALLLASCAPGTTNAVREQVGLSGNAQAYSASRTYPARCAEVMSQLGRTVTAVRPYSFLRSNWAPYVIAKSSVNTLSATSASIVGAKAQVMLNATCLENDSKATLTLESTGQGMNDTQLSQNSVFDMIKIY